MVSIFGLARFYADGFEAGMEHARREGLVATVRDDIPGRIINRPDLREAYNLGFDEAVRRERAAAGREVPTPELAAAMMERERMRRAGDQLAAAAARVAIEHDGLHRLRLAIAEWHRTIANEGGRGDEEASEAKDLRGEGPI